MIFPPSLETWAEPNLTPDYPGPATARMLGGALGYGQGGGMPGMAGMGGTSPGWMDWSQGVREYARPQPPSEPIPMPGSYPRPQFQPPSLPSSPGFLGNVWPMYGMPRPEALGPGFQFPSGYERLFQPFRFPSGYEQQFQPFRLPPSLPYPYNLSRFPWSTPGAMLREALPPLPAPAWYPQAPTAPLVPPEAQVAPTETEGAALRRARRAVTPAEARHEKEVPKGYEEVAASLPPGTSEEDIEAEWAYRTGRSKHKPRFRPLSKEQKEQINRAAEPYRGIPTPGS